MVIPFYRAMRIYLPRFKRLCAAVRKDGIELIHLTTPGPVGLAALYVAAVLADLTRRPGWHLVERWNYGLVGTVEPDRPWPRRRRSPSSRPPSPCSPCAGAHRR